MGRFYSTRLLMAAGLMAACGDGPADLPVVDTPEDTSSRGDTGGDTKTSTESSRLDGGTAGTDSQPSDTGSEVAFDNFGVCGMSGEALVSSDGFEGFEEYYLIADEGMGDDLCRIRFDLVLVGDPPVACDICSWAFVVERRHPATVVDENGTCALSALRLDREAVDALDGERTGYGYVPEYVGHSNVLMQLNEETETWEAVTFAAWDEESKELFYDRRDGLCGY